MGFLNNLLDITPRQMGKATKDNVVPAAKKGSHLALTGLLKVMDMADKGLEKVISTTQKADTKVQIPYDPAK